MRFIRMNFESQIQGAHDWLMQIIIQIRVEVMILYVELVM